VHLEVTALVLGCLFLIELILRLLGLDDKPVPGVNITMADWMLGVEFWGAILIIGFGIVEALLVLLFEMILYCTSQIREIRKAWN
jgi:hypothetical protein